MADHIQATLDSVSAIAEKHESVAVGFSGGKDSLACLDLACRYFKHVYAYYFYFVPGLEVEESKLSIARDFFKVEVLHYPERASLDALRTGLFCDEITDMPELSPRIMYNMIKAQTGATLIITGEKKSDGIFRRRRIANQKETMADVYRPLEDWLRWEVLSYLKGRRIPIPDKGTGDNGGVSLIDKEILFLKDHYPNDYETIKSFFPYVETVVKRREWFGT